MPEFDFENDTEQFDSSKIEGTTDVTVSCPQKAREYLREDERLVIPETIASDWDALGNVNFEGLDGEQIAALVCANTGCFETTDNSERAKFSALRIGAVVSLYNDLDNDDVTAHLKKSEVVFKKLKFYKSAGARSPQIRSNKKYIAVTENIVSAVMKVLEDFPSVCGEAATVSDFSVVSLFKENHHWSDDGKKTRENRARALAIADDLVCCDAMRVAIHPLEVTARISWYESREKQGSTMDTVAVRLGGLGAGLAKANTLFQYFRQAQLEGDASRSLAMYKVFSDARMTREMKIMNKACEALLNDTSTKFSDRCMGFSYMGGKSETYKEMRKTIDPLVGLKGKVNALIRSCPGDLKQASTWGAELTGADQKMAESMIAEAKSAISEAKLEHATYKEIIELHGSNIGMFSNFYKNDPEREGSYGHQQSSGWGNSHGFQHSGME